VRCKSQQLFTRKLLAHHHFAAQVQSHQMKYRLTQVNADQMQFHGCHLPAPFISQVRDLDRRRTIPLSGKRPGCRITLVSAKSTTSALEARAQRTNRCSHFLLQTLRILPISENVFAIPLIPTLERKNYRSRTARWVY